MITVKRYDPYTQEVNYMTLPITERQLELYEAGQILAKEAFPNLTPAQREFIISGMTQESWDKHMNSTKEN